MIFLIFNYLVLELKNKVSSGSSNSSTRHSPILYFLVVVLCPVFVR